VRLATNVDQEEEKPLGIVFHFDVFFETNPLGINLEFLEIAHETEGFQIGIGCFFFIAKASKGINDNARDDGEQHVDEEPIVCKVPKHQRQKEACATFVMVSLIVNQADSTE